MRILELLFKPNIAKLKSRKDIEGLMWALANKDLSIQKDAVMALREIGNSMVKEFSLVYVVFRGQLETIKLMLESYASSLVNKTDIPGLSGCSILFYSTLFGKSEIVTLLLEHGAHPNAGKYSPLSQAKQFGHKECITLLESVQAREGNVLIDIEEEIDCIAIESQVLGLESYTDNLLGLLSSEVVNAERDGSEWVHTSILLKKWEADKKISWRHDDKQIFHAERVKRYVLEQALVNFLVPKIVDDPRLLTEWEGNKKPEVVIIGESLPIPLSRTMQELISLMQLPETNRERKSSNQKKTTEKDPHRIKTLEEVAQMSLAATLFGFARRKGTSFMHIRNHRVSDKEMKGMFNKAFLELLFYVIHNDILSKTLKQLIKREEE